MHICLVYDCLFPWTVGGAERWYRALGERLAAQGHAVTYLTLRQWARGEEPEISGIRVIAVGPRLDLYAGNRRRIGPPLRFGLGVLAHLLRHGRAYDHVHLASFPYFSLLAAALARPLGGYTVGVDWHEVWTRDYWRSYLGAAGALGWAVQRLCAMVPQRAFAFSRLHLRRLADLARDGTLLPGEYAGERMAPLPAAEPPYVAYFGRLIPEKRVDLLLEAFALVRVKEPELTLQIFGDGPEKGRLSHCIAQLALGDRVRLGGFVPQAQLDAAMGAATAVVQPSEREGYGMVVVEAAARGVPAIVVEAPDNAAVELVDDGENGLVAQATAAALAEAIVTVCRDRAGFRARTADWYLRNAERLSLDHSLSLVTAAIAG